MSSWVEGRVSVGLDWIKPQVGHKYYSDAGEHPGQVGTCIDRFNSEFGMRWALLKYEDGSMETYRTILLLECDDSEDT